MSKNVEATSYTITATGTGGTYNSWENIGVVDAVYNISISGAGIINVYTGYQKHTTHGERQVYVARSGGTSGAASVSYGIVNGYNSNAGAQSGTVSWSDGEGGFKPITITTATGSESGPSWLYVSLSSVVGSTLGCREHVICVDDSTVPADANAVFVATTGNDTTGNGSLASPYLTVTKAKADLTTTKCNVVMRGGTYPLADEATFNIVGNPHDGIALPAPAGGLQVSNSTRTYFMSYPSETAKLGSATDTGEDTIAFGGGTGAGADTGDYCTIYNIEISDIFGAGIRLYDAIQPHVLSCTIFDCNGQSAGGNYAAIFNQDTVDAIYADNNCYNISLLGDETNNNVAAIGITYYATRTMWSNNQGKSGAHGIFRKAPVLDTTTWHDCWHSNLVYDAAGYGYYSANANNSGNPAKNIHMCGNVDYNSNGGMQSPYSNIVTTQDNIILEHNTLIPSGGAGDVINVRQLNNATILGNVIDAIATTGVGIRDGVALPVSSFGIVDYNLYTSNITSVWSDVNAAQGSVTDLSTNLGYDDNGEEGAIAYSNIAPPLTPDKDLSIASGVGFENAHDGHNKGAYFLINPGLI